MSLTPLRGLRQIVLLIFIKATFVATVWSAESTEPPFPRILTLGEALSMLDSSHPDMLATRARLAGNSASQIALDDRYRVESVLSIDLRASDRIAISDHDFLNDSSAVLSLDKPLTRFGGDRALFAAVEKEREGIEQQQQYDLRGIRLSVVQAFFDAIVADYAYSAQDEKMTLAYLRFDDAEELMQRFNEVAEVDVRKLQVQYLDEFAKRTVAGHNRRAKRLELALALNRSDAYPDQLVEPDLSAYDREVPDYEKMLALVLEQSSEIRIARLQLDSAQQQLEAASRTRWPVLGTRLQAAEYNNTDSSSRDQFRASLYLDIPLGSARLSQAAIGAAQADVLSREADLATLENRLRVKVLQLVQKLGQLETEQAAAEAELLYSELELDRVRSQYEMEIRARIGSANAVVAAALYRNARARYQKALIWEQLDSLSNTEPVEFQ